MSNVPEMTEIAFTPLATVTFVDGEVQSVVIDWAGSYDEVASGMSHDDAEPLTWTFDNWLIDQGAVGGRLHLSAEDE